MVQFSTRLEQASEATQSLVCVGLDPDASRMPVDDVFEFNRAIVDATKDLVCAYKPNAAFYEALGLPGLDAMARTVAYIHETAPQAVVIGDVKRGDIGPSGQSYAKASFEVWGFDAVTVNAWGGLDSVEPFISDGELGIFVWCRGSNPGSADIQDLMVDTPQGKIPLYQHLAGSCREWNTAQNVGLVVGATYPDQLEAVRNICPDMPILIPGVGAQGGDLESAVRLGTDNRGRLAVISSSRGIIYASSGRDFAERARAEAAAMRLKINETLTIEGLGWP
ncbi:MAG: orotidine-5'-phosphate decarboxylase [SAR202 cluster bacterium Io17-Chloro-G4]|nr:MAG: orotidine-5'-phosphate decarboxylase [SAR202 cluster bacterium Io17-Chloro-G4]